MAGLILILGLPVKAQLPAPNPLVAPLPAPSGPPTLTAPGQALAVPSLAAVPTLPAASPSPATRAFNCSCFGFGMGTRWMGQIAAPGYFAARQAATGACLAYRLRVEPNPALVAAQSATPVVPQSFANPDAAASIAASLPGGLSITTTQQQQACTHCLCN
jgi:hypothetical protein